MSNTKMLVAYNLMDYSSALQEAVLEGYRITDSNAGYPQQLGVMFSCQLVKPEVNTTEQTEGKTKKETKAK